MWADGPSNVWPPDLDGMHVDVRCICDKAPQELVFEALRQLLEQKLIVWYGPDPGPGGRTVCKFYHIFKNTYSEVGPDAGQGQGWSSGEIPALTAASEEPFDTTTRGCVGADAGEPARDATGDVGTDPGTGAAAGASANSGTADGDTIISDTNFSTGLSSAIQTSLRGLELGSQLSKRVRSLERMMCSLKRVRTLV